VRACGHNNQLPYVPPGGLPADESFADAICCDPFFRPLAEPEYFFQQPDVDLFNKVRAYHRWVASKAAATTTITTAAAAAAAATTTTPTTTTTITTATTTTTHHHHHHHDCRHRH
jgi:hypothetical protein